MTNDMTKGAITPLLIRFTIPLVLGNLFQLTYNAADSIIVGKFVGEEALAAVGTSNPLMTLAILFINGMCLGAGILVSTAFGAGDTELVERQVSTTAIAGTVFSLAFSLLCILLANPLLRLLQVPAEILPIAVNYLRIVFAGLLFTFIYNFLAATLRALGADTKLIRSIFVGEGLLIGGLGASIGAVLGVGFCLAQQHFGMIRIPVDTLLLYSYPVEMRWSDLLIVAAAFGAVILAISELTVRSVMKNNKL